jgi:tripartite ATP-independent transporter DctM subunit
MTAIMEQFQNLVASSGISAHDLSIILILALFVLMFVGLICGQELAFVLGGVGAIVGWLAWGQPGIQIAMTKVYDQMQSYSMVAIPMFVLMANFLTHSKVADGLFESVRYLFGPFKGGLGVAVILVSTVFAATTGIVGASVVTMGMLSMPVLLKSGYNKSLASGMVCAGGSLGILIPPSIMLVSMGSFAQLSVGKIFFAAIIPGLTLSACYIIYIIVITRVHPDYGPAMSEAELAEMPLKKRITGSLVNLIPPLLLIFAVLGSIFAGIATPTEAAGVGAFFALIMTIFYKQFSLKMLKDSLIDTAKTTAMVFIILFGASAFTGVFLSLDGDQIISDWVLGMGIGKWGAFAIMMLIVFILGMFIDWLGIVMIVFPIFLPLMDAFGFDRLFIVTVTAVMLQTCFMTPPFGFALFYIKGIVPDSVRMQDIYKGVIPFIVIIIAVVALCVLFPDQLIYALPSMLAE